MNYVFSSSLCTIKVILYYYIIAALTMNVYGWTKMSLRGFCFIFVMLVAFIIATWNSTEITAPVYRVTFTVDRREITLSPFPYDVSGVVVSVPTSEDLCYWRVNNSQHHHYVFNDTFILLQPFGQHFTSTSVTCTTSETGITYTLLIGDTCPCKNLLSVRAIRQTDT